MDQERAQRAERCAPDLKDGQWIRSIKLEAKTIRQCISRLPNVIFQGKTGSWLLQALNKAVYPQEPAVSNMRITYGGPLHPWGIGPVLLRGPYQSGNGTPVLAWRMTRAWSSGEWGQPVSEAHKWGGAPIANWSHLPDREHFCGMSASNTHAACEGPCFWTLECGPKAMRQRPCLHWCPRGWSPVEFVLHSCACLSLSCLGWREQLPSPPF